MSELELDDVDRLMAGAQDVADRQRDAELARLDELEPVELELERASAETVGGETEPDTPTSRARLSSSSSSSVDERTNEIERETRAGSE